MAAGQPSRYGEYPNHNKTKVDAVSRARAGGVPGAEVAQVKFQLAADEWHGSGVAGKLAVR
jgi:hypothetical protein